MASCKKFGYSTVREMREEILLNNQTLKGYCKEHGAKATGGRTSKAWQSAVQFADNQENWRLYMLARINERMNDLVEILDDYYNEGFCQNDLDDNAKIILQRVILATGQ